MPSLHVLLLALPLFVFSALTSAVTVEAEGQAPIYNQDVSSARQQALHNATQQAILQAGAYVSSTQRLEGGVLSVDNLQVLAQGNLTDIRILREQAQGNVFKLLIRAEVQSQDHCENSRASLFLKSAAVAAFPLQQRSQGNLGGLHNAEQAFSQHLASGLNLHGHLKAMNASHLNVNINTATTTGSQRDNGIITNALPIFKEFDVQFIVSGVIRDLTMLEAGRSSEGNLFQYYYDKADYRGRQHLRHFAVDVFIHDGFTGALLFNRSYYQVGLWNTDDHLRTGFATPAFFKTDYGIQVQKLMVQVSKEVNDHLKCEPFRARIIQTDRNRITFNAGTVTGIRPGDQLRVYRKATFYDQSTQPHIRLEETGDTLVVTKVHPRFAEGNIDADAAEHNIQPDDVLLIW
jgi:hypothetical protein